MQDDRPNQQRLFIGVFPGGISYCDREREKDDDYARVAFLPYTTLDLHVENDCPAELLPQVLSHAKSIQAERGQFFRTSACNQGVILGSKSRL